MQTETEFEGVNIQLVSDLQGKAADDVVKLVKQTMDLLTAAGVVISSYAGSGAHLSVATAVIAESLKITSGMLAILHASQEGTLTNDFHDMSDTDLHGPEPLAKAITYGTLHVLTRIKSVSDQVNQEVGGALNEELHASIKEILIKHLNWGKKSAKNQNGGET
jgi:hypothetical protein